MSLTIELQEAFKELIKIPEMTFIATVKSVDKQEKTVVVESEDLEYLDVRLTSVINDSNKVVVYPKAGTTVLVGLIGNDENTLFVCAVSEVEGVEGVIGDLTFEIDTSGVRLTRKEVDIKQVLVGGFTNQNLLNKELQKVLVSIGTSPNVITLKEIENDNNKVIEGIQTIFK